MQFSSRLIEQAVEAFNSLPGIGKKTALRLVLHLVDQQADYTADFTKVLKELRDNIKECEQCHNLSDSDLCTTCADQRRDKSVICVVEGVRDVMAIEETAQFRGLYHVLGGVISPIDGIGPKDLNIDTLLSRASHHDVKEIIMAISPTIEGDTTIYYLSKQLAEQQVKISTIARGVSFGGELEYADGVTLGRSIATRRPYGAEGE